MISGRQTIQSRSRSDFMRIHVAALTLTLILLVFVGCAPPAPPEESRQDPSEGESSPVPVLDPLQAVEQDQFGAAVSSHDIFNRNIALNVRRNLTHVSSYRRGAFGHLAHDGNLNTHWLIGPEESEGTLRISWGLAVPVNRVEIVEQNSGSISSLKLELYTGSRWVPIEPVNPARRNFFHFDRMPASGLRITIETGAGAAGISEVSVFDTEQAAPLPRYGTAALIEAMRSSDAVILFDGSPYAYSRTGRKLIKPRAAEASLSDSWTREVIEYIGLELGGSVAEGDADTIRVSLNGNTFPLELGPDANVVERIQSMAEQAGFEFVRQGPLVMVGSGLEALRRDAVVSELEALLGRNPYFVEERVRATPDAVITPTLSPEGITYEWAGFRTSYLPGTNSAAWYKYAELNAIRSWFNASRYVSRYVKPPEEVTTPEQFEAYKREVRASPENNGIFDTKGFMNRFHAELSAEFSMYKQLGIHVINQTGPKHWPDTLQDDLVQWSATYAATYYLAKYYGVAAHQFGNEPDSFFNQSTDEQIARRVTLIADAVHAAIEDVNRVENLALAPIFTAPVLAGNFLGRNGRIMMRNLYTRYDGSASPTPLFQMFNRHRYGNRPHQNALEVRQAKQMMQEEAGEVLPQLFTELNFSTGGNWVRPHITYTNDTPAVFTAMAGIWGWMMQEQGVYGIFIFKLDDPEVYSRPGVGPFHNVVTYSMFPEQDPGTARKTPQQISYGTKNFEVSRLFSRGFHGSRPLLGTEIACSDVEYRAWTTLDADAGRIYIWSVQPDEHESYELEFDLSKLDLPPGVLVTAETVSGARHGEVTHVMTLPADRKIRIHQAPESAMLLTVHQQPLLQTTLLPEADAMVVQGEHSHRNFGGEPRLKVGRHSNPDHTKISFLRFDLSVTEQPVQRAVLELHGQSVNTHAYDGGFLFRVYAVADDDWTEDTITAENAPNLYRTVSALKTMDLENYPLGHVTGFNTPAPLRVDVTRAVEEARLENRKSLTLVLIREIHWPEEETDTSSALLSSREAGPEFAPKLHVWH